MSWVILHVDTRRDQCDTLEEMLLSLGAVSVTLTDNADQPLLEPGVGETPLWDAVRLSAMFNADTNSKAIIQLLEQQFTDTAGSWRAEILEDKDWVRSWMDSYQPLQMGQRLWICPGWLEPPAADAVNLMLDPGLAFGTGTHPTTALCLNWLDAQHLAAKSMIDYGCGSGILAIAALMLGARHATGIDNDPQAILASRQNAERNQLSDAQLTLLLPENASDLEAADVVVANILAGPLADLAGRITRLVKPGGSLCLSGILEAQAASVMAAYPLFTFEPAAVDDGWVRLVARKGQ